MKRLRTTLLGLLLLVMCSFRLHGAVSVAFDPTDSNVGAGLYDFILSGAPASATLANYNSAFTITGWAAPGIGNNVTIMSTMAPSAWNLTQNDSNNAKWLLESTTAPSNSVDGRFEVQAKPGLSGSSTWQLAWPGDNTYSASGFVFIPAVPEPAPFGVSAVVLAVLALMISIPRRVTSGAASMRHCA